MRRGLSSVAVPVTFALALLAAGYAAIEFLVAPRIDDLHARAFAERAERYEVRIMTAINALSGNLDATCGDWAEWDSMYEFALDPDPSFIEENFQPDSVAGINCSRIYVEDEDGVVLARQDYDVLAGEAADFGLTDQAWQTFAAADPRIPAYGLMLGPDGNLSFVASKPLARSDGSGDFEGRIVFIRPLVGDEADSLARIIGTEVITFDTESAGASGAEFAQARRVSLESPLPGVLGGPLGWLRTEVDFSDLADRHAIETELLRNASLVLLLTWLICVLFGGWLGWFRDLSPPSSALLPLTRTVPVVIVCLGGLVTAGLCWQLTDRMLTERAESSLRSEAQEIEEHAEASILTHEHTVHLLAGVMGSMSSSAPVSVLYETIASASGSSPDTQFLILSGIEETYLEDQPALSEFLQGVAGAAEQRTLLGWMPGGDGGEIKLITAAPFYASERAFRTPEQRRQDLRGILVGAIPLSKVTSKAASHASELGLEFEIARAGDAGSASEVAIYSGALTGIDGDWEVRIHRSAGSSQPLEAVLPWVILLAGLFTTATLAAYVRSTLRRSAEVEAVVEQRTRELGAATAAAERANLSKSMFIANMSHEIRTPMTAILGYAEELLEPNLSRREFVENVGTIRRNGDYLLQILNDILDLSKIEAGKMSIEIVHCSPIQVLDDVLQLMHERAEVKGLALESELVGPLPEAVLTDPTRLRQIMINLIGNAIKFTSSGKVSVRLHMHERSGQDGGLSFEVRDSGIGMDEDQLRRLFRPFEQADASTSRRFGGTGLGLIISRDLARLIGGEISVTSALGKGSCFTLTISTGSLLGVGIITEPRFGVHPETTDATMPNSSSTQVLGRILIAEDMPTNQVLLRRILEKAGARCEVAENGRVAVDRALAAEQSGEPFDLVLMDMQMPVLDGLGATRELRERGYQRPIIALTANAMSEDRERFLAAGCVDFLSKPINRAQLLSAIRNWLVVAPEPEPVSQHASSPDLTEMESAMRTALESRDWDALASICEEVQRTMPSAASPASLPTE